MTCMGKNIMAVGFGLGGTLAQDAGRLTDETERESPALICLAMACAYDITPADIRAGQAILKRRRTGMISGAEDAASAQMLGEILAAWGQPNPSEWTQAEDAFFAFFQEPYAVYPDACSALRVLRASGVKIGVLTDAPYGMPRRLVEEDLMPIASCLDVILTSADVGWRRPHPQGYAMLAEQLGAPPSQMCYVGNDEKDIAGARAAGMTALLIDRHNGRAGFGQDGTLTCLTELLGSGVFGGE